MERIGKKLWDLFELLVRAVVGWFLRLFKITLSEEQWVSFFQFVKFALIGVSNTLISYLIYVLFLLLGFHYLVGQYVGFVVATLNSFFWNNRFVFQKKEGEQRNPIWALIKVFLAYGVSGLLLAPLLLIFWCEVLHVSEFLAPILNIFIVTPINFVLNKLWAFRTKKEDAV